MTRAEFVENVCDWSELLNFCYDNDCNECEDIYSSSARDEYINENLINMVDNASDWRDLLHALDNIDDGYDYYIRDEYGEWPVAGDYEFDHYKGYVLEWMDKNEYWDDEEEEEYGDCDAEEEEESIEEDVSFFELFSACSGELQHIDADAKAKEQEVDDEFAVFVGEIVAMVEGRR